MSTEPRWCYFIPVGQNPEKHGGYVPAFGEEDKPGHAMMTGRGVGSAPWIWGQTLEEAEQTCNSFNQERLGISPDEASNIVLSTMAAQNKWGFLPMNHKITTSRDMK